MRIQSLKMTEPTPTPSSNVDDDPATAEVDNQIWTPEEKVILKSHVDGYRSALRNLKAKFVVAQVIPKIKVYWKGRYDRKKLKKDRELKKEWNKKKEVILRAIFVKNSLIWDREFSHGSGTMRALNRD